MHYRLPGGAIVRSENAAKPERQKSSYFVAILSKLAPVERTLDYGCGKLRYLEDLLLTTEELYVTDSDIQLTRGQILFGCRGNIIDFLRPRNHVHVIGLKKFNEVRDFFDRVILANVLQVVPMVRLRSIIIRRIFRSLRPGGELIAVVQYRNSDFDRMMKMPNSYRYSDGMVIRHIRGTSFYGFIRPPVLQELLTSEGFEISETKLYDGSCYITAHKPTD